jgi:hypothetical protein
MAKTSSMIFRTSFNKTEPDTQPYSSLCKLAEKKEINAEIKSENRPALDQTGRYEKSQTGGLGSCVKIEGF